MTRPRYDEHSTEFGLWLREQEELDSSIGFVTTNLDYIWRDYKNKQFMLIEEKRFGSTLKFPQSRLLKEVHEGLTNHCGYCGFFLIQFENTSPEDGAVFVTEFFANPQKRYQLTSNELIQFLQFKPLESIIDERAMNAATLTALMPNTRPAYQAEEELPDFF